MLCVLFLFFYFLLVAAKHSCTFKYLQYFHTSNAAFYSKTFFFPFCNLTAEVLKQRATTCACSLSISCHQSISACQVENKGFSVLATKILKYASSCEHCVEFVLMTALGCLQTPSVNDAVAVPPSLESNVGPPDSHLTSSISSLRPRQSIRVLYPVCAGGLQNIKIYFRFLLIVNLIGF